MNSFRLQPKLLVTGASGFLGWHLCQAAASRWQVYGTHSSRPATIPGTAIRLNLRDLAALKHLFQTIQPDAIVHLAAEANLNRCQDDPASSYNMNVTVTSQIAELCADADIPLVFSSTDQVFDGTQPPYREADPVCPINYYGEHKAEAEAEILSRYPKAAICRMPLMFGSAPAPAGCFLQPFLQTLRDGQILDLFIDEIRTPVSGTTAAKGLLLALQHVQGRIHLGGRESISRFEFGLLMADVFGLPTTAIKACHQRDVKMSAPRPPDVSLDSSRALSLGYAPASVREELMALMLQD